MIWITKFNLKQPIPSDFFDLLEEVALKDDTFVIERDQKEVRILSESKKQAYRRGKWLKERLNASSLYFQVFRRLPK